MNSDRPILARAILLLAAVSMGLPWARAAQITVGWDAPVSDVNDNTLSAAVTYRLYYGTASGDYPAHLEAGDQPKATVTGLVEGTTYYMAATACTADGQESAASAELVCRIPDMTPPELTFGGSSSGLVFLADADGRAVIPDLRGSLVIRDNCSPVRDVRVVQSPLGSTPIGLGARRITFTACDSEDNTDVLSLAVTVVRPGGSPEDVDADQLVDTWEVRFFGGLDGEHGLPSDDWDHDGFLNLQEFVAGTDPMNPSSSTRLQLARLTGQGLSVAFPALAAAGIGYEGKRRFYTLQRCDDLTSGEWSAVPGYENIPAADQTVVCGMAGGIGSAAFYRLMIRLE